MTRLTNWTRESRTPTLAYRHTETDARAVLHRAPNSYVHTWRAALLVEGYPVWSRGFTTKDATIDLIGRFKTLRKEFLRRATHEY